MTFSAGSVSAITYLPVRRPQILLTDDSIFSKTRRSGYIAGGGATSERIKLTQCKNGLGRHATSIPISPKNSLMSVAPPAVIPMERRHVAGDCGARKPEWGQHESLYHRMHWCLWGCFLGRRSPNYGRPKRSDGRPEKLTDVA